METTVDVEQVEAAVEADTQKTADAERTQEERFKWRAWVHTGTSALDCNHATDGKCKDEEHFHAVIRLPNPFQIRDIAEKAQAARARRARMFRDPESDISVVLEDEMEMLRETDKAILVDEIVERDFARDYTEAIKVVMEIDDPDFVPEGDESIPKKFANIEQDREEYVRQRDLPDEQKSDDFEELEKTYADYSRAIEAEMERIRQPRVESLMEREMDDLVEMVRKDRIEQACGEAQLHTFNMWQMYVCTYRPREKGIPNERVWPSIEFMKYVEDTDTIMAVRDAFQQLESSMAAHRLGKASSLATHG